MTNCVVSMNLLAHSDMHADSFEEKERPGVPVMQVSQQTSVMRATVCWIFCGFSSFFFGGGGEEVEKKEKKTIGGHSSDLRASIASFLVIFPFFRTPHALSYLCLGLFLLEERLELRRRGLGRARHRR